MSSDTTTTALSEAQQRVFTVKTDTGDIVRYSGNPAELSGARYETRKAMQRAGAFALLVQHNACRVKGGTICVEHLDTIPIIAKVLIDPNQDTYTYEKPCPDTATRIKTINESRSAAGLADYTGVPNLTSLPANLIKIAMPNEHEVKVEALAYALTQLSIFDDEEHANELLELCEYDGRKLAPFFDEIERQASGEDITLVTGRRNAFKEAGLKGLPLSLASFKTFFKEFNLLERRCPPNERLSDHDLAQLVGTLFIKDPSQREKWSSHINQPTIRDGAGASA